MSEPATAQIRVRLRELPQLFNSMDPSPFLDRDLDADAEEFILSWARELPAKRDLELVIHVATPPPPDRLAGVEDAVRHYFESRAEMKRREFRRLMHRGRVSLIAGLLFLAACLFLAQLVTRQTFPGSGVVTEGLTIIGWVAMWRPLEIYLYDWWPLRDELRILERLARMKVQVVPPRTQAAPSAPAAPRQPGQSR